MRSSHLLRSLVVLGLLALHGGRAHAAAPPLRVHVACESDWDRTKACPAFLLGFLDAHPALLASPLAGADVTLFVHTTQIASVDRLHLRFTSALPHAPPAVEFDVDLDSRSDDDSQRAVLEPAFLRGIALYVAVRQPDLVEVALAAPSDDAAVAAPHTTPWDISLSLGGYASWTDRYKSYNGWSNVSVSRLTPTTRSTVWGSSSGYMSLQPPLIAPDGSEISLDSRQWYLSGGLSHVTLLTPHWSIGAATSTWTNDPKGQYRYGWDVDAGLEWDKFHADDPRGNSLAVAYKIGYQVEAYNLRNELDQTSAHYPTHELSASGAFRRDKITYGLDLSAGGALLRPAKRHHVTIAPSITWTIGSHVDLSLSGSVTKRDVPGPHPDAFDMADYELISRSSYAEPVSASGSFNIRIYWERSNGARNDRLSNL